MPLTQETKQKIFSALKKVMVQFHPPLVNKGSGAMGYELIGNTPSPYGYKKEMVPGMYFASAAIRKDSVVFYFFPIYSNPNEFKNIAPATLKCLKGKTCFHFRKEEDVNEKELKAMFEKGIAFYKKMGWIKQTPFNWLI